MRHESPECAAVAGALVSSERLADSLRAHVAGCAVCREAEMLVEALATVHPTAEAPPVPTAGALRGAYRARVARRVGGATALAAALLATLLRVGAAPEAPPPDLLAVLDDVDSAVAPADPLPGEDLLALVDPSDEDLLGGADPLIDALLGEGSL